MRENQLKQRLQNGEVLLGAFNNINHTAIVEILALAGIDFVILDGEHSSLTPETAETLYIAAERRDLSCVTRIGENTPQRIQKFLDSGANGVLIPLVNSAADAQQVVDAVKYTPLGKRGLAASRVSDWGLNPGGLPAYVEHANRETFIAVQVETEQAIDNIDEINSINEIDMIFFGPSDLSTALGIPGQATHSDVISLIERLGKRAQEAGKITGTIARDKAALDHWKSHGFQFLCTGVNNLLASGIKSFVESLNR